jgi:phosphatidylglycerophosphate synthase
VIHTRWQARHAAVALLILVPALFGVTAAAPLLAGSGLASFLVFAYLCRSDLRGALLANALTAARVLAVFAVLVWHWSREGQLQQPWLAFAILVAAEVTDYFDGRAARRRGPTQFGATFDMEVDAAVTAALALLAVLYRQAPAWLLAAGLWRYAYALWEAALTRKWGKSDRILPCDVSMPSWFRWQAKTICVVAVLGLIILSTPGLSPPLLVGVSAGVVGLLSYSFVAGGALLLRRGAAAR